MSAVYRSLGLPPPEFLRRHIVSRPVLWTFPAPAREIQPGDDLVVRTNCPGVLQWQVGDGHRQESPLFRVVKETAGFGRHELRIRAEPPGSRELRFRFRCSEAGCHGDGPCCRPEWSVVRIGPVAGPGGPSREARAALS